MFSDKRRDRDDRDKDKRRDRDKDKEKDKTKYTTQDPALLLSYVYFDQSHTGYLLDKDVEELLHTMGLHLSRAQVGCVKITAVLSSAMGFIYAESDGPTHHSLCVLGNRDKIATRSGIISVESPHRKTSKFEPRNQGSLAWMRDY